MFNYLASLLDIELNQRQKFIVQPEINVNSSSMEVADFMQVSLINDCNKFYSAWLQSAQIETGEDSKSKFIKELCLQNSMIFWFIVYSRSQEKEMLERFIDLTLAKDLTLEQKLVIIKSLLCSGHLQLAARLGRKFALDIHVDTILSCLETYYFNTGDDKGLYESLLYMEEKQVLLPGPCVSDIFNVELPEVVSLLSKNKIIEAKNPVHIINSLFASHE